MEGGCINWTPSSYFSTGDNPFPLVTHVIALIYVQISFILQLKFGLVKHIFLDIGKFKKKKKL
jgi:hypothetical protein